MAKQVINGQGFEYAIATAFSSALGCKIITNSSFNIAKKCHAQMAIKDRQLAGHSAKNITSFLAQRDNTLGGNAVSITLQDSKAGKSGDVRDILIDCQGKIVGISVKHKHYAIKHPRLSNTIDFGKQWGNCPVSSQYWKKVKPIFDDLEARKQKNQKFNQIKNKKSTIYLPILTAFEDELKRLCEDCGKNFIAKFFQYLIGHDKDFYKAICDKEESVIESVNINGTLAWGSRWKIPNRIESIKRVRGSESTLTVIFDGGWQISFRLHSASTKVEASLKFDVTFTGIASNVSRVSIPH